MSERVSCARLSWSIFVLVACLLCLLLSGCSGLRFDGLRPASPIDLVERIPVAEIGASESLRADDIIVIELVGSDGGAIAAGVVTTETNDTWLMGKTRHFRAPYSQLMGQKLNFKTSLSAHDSVSFAQRFAGPTLSEARASVGSRFRLSVERRFMPDLLAAGDVVELRRQYQLLFAVMSDGSPVDPFTLTRSETFDLLVDARGQVRFPGLSIASDLNDEFDSGDPDEDDRRRAAREALQADLANADAVIQLADPRRRRSEQLSLRALGSCLSEGRRFVVPRTTPDDPARIERCWGAGVKAGFAPKTSGSTSVDNLVYSLRAKPRTWHLIDENGRRSELPLVEGDTILKSVLLQRERLTGVPLLSALRRRAFVIVVPRPLLATDLEAPFYFELRGGLKPEEDYQLWPGDTVILSRHRPKHR